MSAYLASKMIQPTPHIVIAGAGIGGLCAALALVRGGAQVDIFEASKSLSEIGAGLQLSANAMHVLSALGVQSDIKARAFEPENSMIRDYKSGNTLLTVALKGTHHARYGQDYMHIHRADLHEILRDATIKAGAKLHLDHTVTGYDQDKTRIKLNTSKGDISGDILIGADGIKSRLRAQMLGETTPQFTGQTAWRGLIETRALPKGLIPPDATLWVGPKQHFVSYYVRAGSLINFVAVKEQQDWNKESWSAAGDMQKLRQAFAGWDSRITQLLGACEQCHLWGLFDHAPLPTWTDGLAALLGDAAHPMLPFMAQGAAMAIEDSYVLAQEILRSGQAPQKALLRYEASRKPRASKLQAISRANAKLYHLDGAVSKAARAAKFRLAQKIPALAYSQFDPIYGYNAVKA